MHAPSCSFEFMMRLDPIHSKVILSVTYGKTRIGNKMLEQFAEIPVPNKQSRPKIVKIQILNIFYHFLTIPIISGQKIFLYYIRNMIHQVQIFLEYKYIQKKTRH